MFEDFVELILDPDVKSEDLLDDDLILLLVDNQQFKVWLWEGYNTTKRMKLTAAKKALPIREKYLVPRGIPYIIGNLRPHNPGLPIKISPCPLCGSKKIKLRNEKYPLCLKCGFLFNKLKFFV